MTRALNGFNRIAWAYDSLNSLVFGQSIRNAQKVFLNCIPPGGELLVLGGGSGWILDEVFRINPHCKICFIDASSAMIRMAERMVPASLLARVEFIHGTTSDIPKRTFDAIISNFFLDLFPAKTLESELERIHRALRRDGFWLISDFNNHGKWWQRLLLKVMYLFFNVTTGIEATELPPWEQKLDELGMEKKQARMIFGSFIKSILYRKLLDSE